MLRETVERSIWHHSQVSNICLLSNQYCDNTNVKLFLRFLPVHSIFEKQCENFKKRSPQVHQLELRSNYSFARLKTIGFFSEYTFNLLVVMQQSFISSRQGILLYIEAAEWEDWCTVFSWRIFCVFGCSEGNAVVLYSNISKHKECFSKGAWRSCVLTFHLKISSPLVLWKMLPESCGNTCSSNRHTQILFSLLTNESWEEILSC